MNLLHFWVVGDYSEKHVEESMKESRREGNTFKQHPFNVCFINPTARSLRAS